MSDPIRVGIAGLGRSGWSIHARLLAMLPEKFSVVAVVDADETRRNEAVDRFDCMAYTSYGDLLADPAVELVILALPSHLHADLSIAALDVGKHVVCEKPMATSLADADRMVAAAEQRDHLLTIFQNRRYDAHFAKVRSLIDSGALGRIVQIRVTASNFGRRWDWQTLKEFGGGTLNNTGPHFIDLVMQLFGEDEPDQVYCHLDRTLTLGDADDHVKLVFKGEGTPTVDMEMSAACAFPGEFWHIMGTKGGLTGTLQALHWRVVDESKLAPRVLDPSPTEGRSYNRDEITWIEDSWTADEYDGPGYEGYYIDLYETIRNGAPLVVTPQSVRRVIRMMEQCREISPV
ncbi:MAG: Gfo/Idh/MocA family oxidoreductase [Caldilineaceae bacterium]|nr:Gfo/Idh/MocA family oxidoreductase [Caldilineaceae bacterium]